MTEKIFELTEVPISEIVVSNRARKDLGNLDELASSISSEGLLQPILITAEKKLIAGERRLTATKQTGASTILCRIVPDVGDDTLMIMEMMENTARKEFEWHELIDLKYKLYKHWKSVDPDWSYKQTSEKLHCSIGLISGELALAEALEVFPDLRALPSKNKAREAYKKLCQRAQDICSLNSMSDEEKVRLDQLIAGNYTMEDPTAPGSAAISSLHDDFIPDCEGLEDEDVEDFTTDRSRCETPSETSAPEGSAPPVSYIIKSCTDLIAELPDKSVGLLELDPPYAIDFNNTYGKNGKVQTTEDDWTIEQLKEFYTTALPQMHRVLLDDAWALVWTGKEHWQWTNKLAADSGFATQMPGVWVKKSGSSNHPPTTMVSMYENFLLLRKGSATFNTPSFPNTIMYDTTHASRKIHQWEKPVDLYRIFFEALGRTNTIMFSMFAGSGNALIAAALEEMKPVGCDKKQTYIHSFYRRYNSYFLN